MRIRSSLFHQPFGGKIMLKKFMLGSAIALGVGGLVLGTSTVSYVRTGFHSIKNKIKDQIPLDVEIQRARDSITDLKPAIAENLKVIAREEVEVARLQREVDSKKTSLAKSKQAILKLKDDVQSGVKFVSYGGKKYSMDDVRKDLNDRFKSYQTQEATADKLEKILSARERNLEGARRKLDEMLAAKRSLEVEVENLQARLTMVEVAKTSNSFSFNDSQVGMVRQLVSDLGTRIEVEERMADADVLLGEIPVSSDEAPSDLVDQISSYFDRPAASTEALAENR
jgi:chromosome segregation ATPase